MAIKSDLFLIVILAAFHFQVCESNPKCLKFAQEGEVMRTGFIRTLKFSLTNTCPSNDRRPEFLTVDLARSSGFKVLCNMVTKGGTCSPSDACTCNSPTRYQVTWRVEDETLDEVWRLSVTVANGASFLFTVGVKGYKGTTGTGKSPSGPTKTIPSSSRTTSTPSSPGNGGSADDVSEKTIGDGGNTLEPNETLEGTREDPEDFAGILGAKSHFDFIVLGSIAGLLILIVVVFVIVCKMKGQTPASAVRAIRRSVLFENSYHVRRPVEAVQYSLPERVVHTENHYGNVEHQATAGGATPNRTPVAIGNRERDVRPDSFPDFPPPPSSLDSETLDSSTEWFDDNGQHDYYSNM